MHFNKDKFLHIANLYIHPRDAKHLHNSTIDSDITKCFEFITRHKNVMLVGDINAHSNLWFSKHTDKRGELISNLLSDSNQIILNLNYSTRQPSTVSQQPTSPDITTIASNLSHNATWEILHALSSDHLPIKITFNTKTNFKMTQNRNMYTNYKKANWEQYQKEIEELIPNDTTITDVHLANNLLTNIILKSDKHHIPKGKIQNSFKEILPEEIRNKISERDKLRKKDSTNCKIEQLNKDIKESIANHKTNLWKEKLDKNWDHKNNTYILWNTISSLSNKKSKCIKNTTIKFNNKIYDSHQNIAEQFRFNII